MTHHSFIVSGIFGPETLAAMSEAYVAALKDLQDTGQPQMVLDVIAERIIAAATLGECDPVRLRKAALAGMPGEEDWPRIFDGAADAKPGKRWSVQGDSMSEREEKLLRALLLMVRQYLEVRPDGTVDSDAKSAGEQAILALVAYGFMEIVPRDRIFGRWTEAAKLQK